MSSTSATYMSYDKQPSTKMTSMAATLVATANVATTGQDEVDKALALQKQLDELRKVKENTEREIAEEKRRKEEALKKEQRM